MSKVGINHLGQWTAEQFVIDLQYDASEIALIAAQGMGDTEEANDLTPEQRAEVVTYCRERQQIEVCGRPIQYDASGVGHNWRPAAEVDCPSSIQEEIAGEIIDGGQDTCESFRASNGVFYRW